MLALVWSPVRFFRARLLGVPKWGLALGGPLLCGLLEASTALVLAVKTQAVLVQLGGQPAKQAAVASAVFSALGYPAYFLVAAGVLVGIDVLTRDTGRGVRLVEMTGLAFYAFVPFCLFSIVAAMAWVPPAFDARAAGRFHAATEYITAVRSDPWLSTARVMYYPSLAWSAALMSVALHVASGSSRAQAAVAGLALFSAFSGWWNL